ncbi:MULTISPECIES: MarR family winged helix-turn-helix transcriptional regulator [Brucella/Ochrobactrum group]|uniref:MarR family transcriptional regulator n=1 Tax=Ochrobactrum teleogrylli TaxID=2479765 RepID=A0ABD5JRS1_9HYPH|nr:MULTISPECIES: MarR family transcriptional regulator [Brucella]MCI1002874.1 MarR family transcriptional regulator [Ochrobactrum sp. C6C9]RRD22612.1 MarR family transcriptional regulator [Brucellaceae bacterium VT-16-1752]WHT42474.1 MarR family transcriptional regulator [Ochrobactrum sp. SSR]MDX4073301.1 MarR family transcriptional regulator [Brucella sp. NBRC 113783]RLL76710.1 MarR family transcriptional regulator [[Ochrobactrum] soli]
MNKMQDKNQKLPWDNPRFKNWIAVARAGKAVERALAQGLAPFDLKIADLDVLMNIYRHPGESQHDLARRILVGRSNITMLLPKLENRGLLMRTGDPVDKRIIRLTLTPDGEKLLGEALLVYTDLIDRVMAQSTAAQCNAMGNMMRRIADMLEKD